MRRPGEDDGLRLQALDALGPFSPPLAREALETGVAEVEPDILAWTGSTGTVYGHRVVLWLDSELAARVNETPSSVDALTAAVATALAKEPGHALAELEIRGRIAARPPRTAYRGGV